MFPSYPRRAEEAIIEGCAYIYRMYLQSEYTVCIPDEISICSNRGRMESLDNDDVSSLTPAWNRWVMMTIHCRTSASI